MFKKLIFLPLLLLLFCPVFGQNSGISKQAIEKAIRSTDVERKVFSDSAVINLYQGNGVFGTSYGALGLQIDPAKNAKLTKYGKTEYLNMNHFVRAKFGADYVIPLAKFYWEKDPEKITKYSQVQSFYDGTLSTQFEYEKNKVLVKTWFDPVDKNLAGLKINVTGKASNIIFKPSDILDVHYDQKLTQIAKITNENNQWKIELSCLNKKTIVYLKTNAAVKLQDNNLVLSLHSGENNILLSVGKSVAISAEKSLKQNIEWWNNKWQNMGIVIFPEIHAQQMWVRSMAQFLYSFNDEKLGLPPPMGFTGNHWSFGYPQDDSFVHTMLLSTGNIKMAKSWIEYFAERVSGMKAYTKRLMNVDGIMAPWVFPLGDFEGYHTPSVPNKFYYEIHNSGYFARMAYETAVFVNDQNWTQKNAKPIISETAKFYKNIAKKESDNLWHLSIQPSTGQDEKGGVDQDDYLCALYSAQYCMQKAIEYNLDEDGTYAKILSEGLAFPALKSQRGIYFSNKGRGESDFGKQKHPVQLNALAFLPVDNTVSDASKTAYDLRYDITMEAKKPYFFGWTLGEFLLAGSRMGNVSEWQKDWDNLTKADYVDKDWIQVYETSGVYKDAYYNITNGLITQSLLNNVVSDWYGKLEIAKCNPWKGKVFVKDIYSKLGITVNGEIEQTSASLVLKAWKDCEFDLQGEKISLKKNQTIKKNITLK
ncbi:hypothetical protein EV144_104440 [Flavobacterium sp. 270]|uniref:hypothetical protein n=1 Tax=Flavobacterium sp. 270 TaxID=2512114 RepID=UPI001065DC4F|nr:hypothetical protein [Flavobacterium sp. 270]TDW48153.1 hypothetical protein EV144_104440 [Flavobacterium sp. 270]